MAAINYEEIVWVDVNSNFGEDVDPELVIDVAAINNSLFNLFNCPVGSRPFEREYGSDLIKAVFEPTDSKTADFIDLSLFQAIQRWEPRIKLDRSQSYVTATPEGDGFNVNIAYTVLRTQLTANYAFTIRRI